MPHRDLRQACDVDSQHSHYSDPDQDVAPSPGLAVYSRYAPSSHREKHFYYIVRHCRPKVKVILVFRTCYGNGRGVERSDHKDREWASHSSTHLLMPALPMCRRRSCAVATLAVASLHTPSIRIKLRMVEIKKEFI